MRSGFRWGHRPSVVRLGAVWRCANRSQVVAALSAVTDWPRPFGSFGCDRSNRSGLGCFLPLALGAAARSAPRDLKPSWSVAIDRHTR